MSNSYGSDVEYIIKSNNQYSMVIDTNIKTHIYKIFVRGLRISV